jgi:signal transduction histidine kinase
MTKILVVEDAADLRIDIMEVLELEGFDVLGAGDGVEGLNLAKSELPNLIISDIMMPNMDGYELLLKLQTQTRTATIPVLFLTAKAGKQDIRKGMGLGVDDYITKPFSHESLLLAIKARLDKQARVAQSYQQQIDELYSSLTRSLPHELRTPLNTILGYTSFLLEDIYSFDHDKLYTMIETVHQAGKRLEQLTENYLTYAQIELVRLKPDSLKKIRQLAAADPIYPIEIIEYIAKERAEEYAREDDLILEISELSIPFYTDDFKKVVRELIDNAFKFSDQGTSVRVEFILRDGCPTLIVSDDGRGMKLEQIQSIKAFQQFERDYYEQQGLGLGLAIVKGLVEIYDGNLAIESKPDYGTSIIVTLLTL